MPTKLLAQFLAPREHLWWLILCIKLAWWLCWALCPNTIWHVAGEVLFRYSVQFSSVAQSCPTPWNPMNRSSPGLPVHHQLPEFFKLMPIESVIPSSHLILCRPLLLLPPIPSSIRVFSNESALSFRWPKYWSFSFSISPSNEHPGLTSFRMGLPGSPCSPRDSQESSPTPQFILTVKFSDFEKSRFPFICWVKSNQLVALRAKTEEWKVGGKTKREGRYVCQWLIHVSVWQTQHNIVKQLSSN